jgi:hypothetical protein
MATHRVTFTLPERRLGNSDIVFTVHSDDERLGELAVSKGALLWRPANKKLGYVLGWDRFDDLAREFGRRERRPA